MAYHAKDLAKEIGVSAATVSLVLNGKSGVSEARRQQIMELAKVRGLIGVSQGHQSRNIGFVVFVRTGLHADNSSYFSLLINAASNTANVLGYNLVILRYEIFRDRDEQIRQIHAADCEGLLVIATEAIKEDYSLLQSIGLPFVVIDNTLFSHKRDTICINNSLGIQLAFQHLFDLGHRNIGYFRSKAEINSFSERLKNYQRCMSEKKLAIHSNSIIPLSYMGSKVIKEIEPFFGSDTFPTAFLSDNDFVALSAKESLQLLGLRVPEDLSIVGFDNRDFGEIYHPTLTTLGLPRDFLAKIAVETLVNRLENDDLPPMMISIGATLIKRESTAPPKGHGLGQLAKTKNYAEKAGFLKETGERNPDFF